MNLTKNQKIGLAVLVVAVVGYYFYDKNQKSKKAAATPATKAGFVNASGFKKNFSN